MLPPVLGDERGFIHKRGSFFRRIGKKVLGGVPVIGGLATGIGESLGIFAEGPRRPPPVFGPQRRGLGTTLVRPQVSLVPQRATCPPGFFETPGGGCQQVAPPTPKRTSPVPGDGGILEPFIPPIVRDIGQALFRKGGVVTDDVNGFAPDQFGAARVGRFGAGLEPFIVDRMTRKCPTGSVLGKVEADGSFLCYNKRDISNRERKWPRGRRPLLTGGEMRCISVASSAAKKLQRKQKQLEQLGLLKRPSRARRALPAGHVAQVKHG